MNPRYGIARRTIPSRMIMIPMNFARAPAKNVITPRTIRRRGLTEDRAEYAELSVNGPVV